MRMSQTPNAASTPQTGSSSSGIVVWLERCAVVLVVLVALAAVRGVFFPKDAEINMGLSQFSIHQKRAEMLARESDPIKRDSLCIPLSAFGRSIDAQLPPDARVFLLGMLGKENEGKLGYYYFLTYYLFPREVAIAMDKPAVFVLTGEATGRNPASASELAQAGYTLAMQETPDGRWQSQLLKPTPQPAPETRPKTIPSSDTTVAFLLPLAVALAGTRLVRWLFKDLEGVLTMGEWLACGLALCACFVTQTILGLRLAGARLEQPLAAAIFIWAVIEIVLFARRWRPGPPHFKAAYLWWLLLIPAALLLWIQFRLAGLEGLLEYDAVASWAFRAKIFHICAGNELWPWFKNTSLSYAHFDYPLLVPLLHSFTYGTLGHINEFVTKFWPQWMLLLLAWAVLGAGKFPTKRAWLIAAGATVIFLLPMTIDYARNEGATIPLVFYSVLGSVQLALGMVEKQSSRIRLGLLLLLAGALVKFEGMVLVAFWVSLLLLDRDSRAAFWPPRRVALVGLVGMASFTPYAIYRIHGPVATPVAAWMSEMFKDLSRVMHTEPMTWVAFISRRFLNNDFVAWDSPDNLHAVWQGKWTGLESLVDQATLGMGWACLIMLVAACWRGNRERPIALRLFLAFLAFSTLISIVWSSVFPYNLSLGGSAQIVGGRQIYPVFMSWFVAGVILLARTMPARQARPAQESAQAATAARKKN